MKLRVLALILTAALLAGLLGGCGESDALEEKRVRAILKEAKTMTLEELAYKAIEESKGQTLLGLGELDGQEALEGFANYLRTLDPGYTAELRWQQAEGSAAVELLAAEVEQEPGTYSAVLLREELQGENRLIQTGRLRIFLPRAWVRANSFGLISRRVYLPLRIMSKVFLYNSEGDFRPDNFWDFVAEGRHGQFVDIDEDPAGKNFLYMLTEPTYAAWVREAFDALSPQEQVYFQPVIDSVQADAQDLELDENGAYALAWIKLWIGAYVPAAGDEAICEDLNGTQAAEAFGLASMDRLSALREADESVVDRVSAASISKGYHGIGGYGWAYYLFIPDNAPLPWTACAFLAYVTCTEEGSAAWAGGQSGTSSNPAIRTAAENRVHPDGRIRVLDQLDRSLDWWLTSGKLVLEDPAYCIKAAVTVGSWIDIQLKYRPE